MITIHSDDFGYKNYSDKKILQLIRKERVRSVSVLINMAEKSSLSSLVKLVKSKPEIKVGLHLNLIEGKSINHKAYIPSLVYGRGNFYSLKQLIPRIILRMVIPDHIEREIKSQINALKNLGFKVSFIDSHQHLHAITPVAEIVSKVADDEKIKVIRSYSKIKTHSFTAKVKYSILKLAAYGSYFLKYGHFGWPASWNIKYQDSYSFMSWESNKFDILSVKDKKLIFVTHPYLPFDSNTSYMWTF